MTPRFHLPSVWALVTWAWPAVRLIAGLVVAFLLGLALADDPAMAVRFTGGFLQLLGLGTVAVGVYRLGKLFGRPSAWDVLREGGRRIKLIFVKPPPIIAHAEGLVLASAMGKARVRTTLAPGAPLHRRITKLEEDVNRLREEYREDLDDLRAAIREIQAKQASTLQDVRQELHRTTGNLEQVAVGGLETEIVGLIWLLLGVLASSFPAELARVFFSW